MSANLTIQRTDLPYLQRRYRPGMEPVRAAAVPTTTGTSLRLSAPDIATAAPKYEVPLLTANITLTDANPVIRFNKRQSAIGSLTIDGASEFGWEAAHKRGYTLSSTVDVDPDIPVSAGRPLVQFYKGQIILGLRHLHQLRRLVVKGGTDYVVATVGGHRVKIEPDAAGKTVSLIIYRLAGQLELRREIGVDDAGFAQVRPYPGR